MRIPDKQYVARTLYKLIQQWNSTNLTPINFMLSYNQILDTLYRTNDDVMINKTQSKFYERFIRNGRRTLEFMKSGAELSNYDNIARMITDRLIDEIELIDWYNHNN